MTPFATFFFLLGTKCDARNVNYYTRASVTSTSQKTQNKSDFDFFFFYMLSSKRVHQRQRLAQRQETDTHVSSGCWDWQKQAPKIDCGGRKRSDGADTTSAKKDSGEGET